jgi:hypothetical protein
VTARTLVAEVLDATPTEVPAPVRLTALVTAVAGTVGLGISFALGGAAAGWVAVLVSAVLTVGLGVVGILISAIFQLTNAKWGRAYRRLAEASVVFMPIGLALVVVYLIGTALTHEGLPWVHHEHLSGGKDVWLVRGFWDLRVLAYLASSYGLALAFLYYSLRRDFTFPDVAERLSDGWLARRLGRGIGDPEAERARCEARLAVLAPLVALVYAFAFTFLAFDLIMALEPQWFSTLFGGWYFIGHIFASLALLAIASLSLRNRCRLERFLPEVRQRDLATLLFAFCLVHIDFFWSQYLTIWYGNLPEETHWLIERTADGSLPWAGLSWATLIAFFLIPFVALLFRRVKRGRVLLTTVATVVVTGIFLARFLEIAPALLDVTPETARFAVQGSYGSLLSSALLFLGCLGTGGFFYYRFLTRVPILPVGDEVFVREFGREEQAP